jgi:hypothetical protein
MVLVIRKVVTKLLEIWVRDPGSKSWIRKKLIPDQGVKKDTGYRFRIRNKEF